MASPDTTSSPDSVSNRVAHRPGFIGLLVTYVLEPLASLKLTVLLFALGIFIVLAGTLAQTEDNIDTVMQNYFRVKPWSDSLGFANIEVRIFFPRSFFPEGHFPV